MKIDLHIHTRDCSDGNMTTAEIFEEAHRRQVRVISITDHDSIDCQESAESLAARYGMKYIPGVELNITFSHPRYRDSKPVALDVLGYQYDIRDKALTQKLQELRQYRKIRAEKILEKFDYILAFSDIRETIFRKKRSDFLIDCNLHHSLSIFDFFEFPPKIEGLWEMRSGKRVVGVHLKVINQNIPFLCFVYSHFGRVLLF